MKRKAAYAAPVILGILFCFYYVRTASDNVAFSDYIRLINSYLPDVDNPAKFFVPDILTRVPITYLGRLVNVRLLGYNTMFDIGLGVLGMGAGAAALAAYGLREKRVSWAGFLLCLFVYFSLNKWEMMTNGTGWVCFLSVSGFIFHYEVLDHAVRTGGTSKRDRILLILLPLSLTLLVAGPYCGSYSAILILAYAALLYIGFRREKKWNRLYLSCLLAVVLSLGLYLWSNSYAVYVHRGAVEGGSVVAEFIKNPVFFIKFMLKAFASAVLGWNQIQALSGTAGIFGSAKFIYLLGAAVIGLYLYALYLNWRFRLYETTIFPLLLILNGGLNHLLILSARWIFLKEEYGMSSRYAVQYQLGIIGIMLTFFLVLRIRREGGKKEAARTDAEPVRREIPRTEPDHSGAGRTAAGSLFQAAVIAAGLVLILAGNAWTTGEELKTAPFRKDYLQVTRELGLNYRTAGDEELETYLHHDAEEIRKAMGILEENNLNIFRKQDAR